jgi:hypothetical protein
MAVAMADARLDHPQFFGMDCDNDTYVNEQYYMLKDRLWRKINPSIDGMLCLPCAEECPARRLARRIKIANILSLANGPVLLRFRH